LKNKFNNGLACENYELLVFFIRFICFWGRTYFTIINSTL